TYLHLKLLETFSAIREKLSLRTNGSVVWNLRNCRKQFQEKSAVSNCGHGNSSFGQADPAPRWNFSRKILERHCERGRTKNSFELRCRHRSNFSARLHHRRSARHGGPGLFKFACTGFAPSESEAHLCGAERGGRAIRAWSDASRCSERRSRRHL